MNSWKLFALMLAAALAGCETMDTLKPVNQAFANIGREISTQMGQINVNGSFQQGRLDKLDLPPQQKEDYLKLVQRTEAWATASQILASEREAVRISFALKPKNLPLSRQMIAINSAWKASLEQTQIAAKDLANAIRTIEPRYGGRELAGDLAYADSIARLDFSVLAQRPLSADGASAKLAEMILVGYKLGFSIEAA